MESVTPPVQPSPNPWQRFTSWLSLQSQTARIALGVGALVIGCGCCSLGYAVGSSSSSPSTANAAATATSSRGPVATATPVTPTATPKPKAWVNVQHFTGNQNGKTASFAVKDGDKIVWSVQVGGEFGGNFSITSYNADGSYGDLIANTLTPPAQSGSTIVHGDASIYLDISDSAGAYDIAVQRFQ
jgi:hypothetical protein